jgi:hypothetical protein
LSWAFIGRAAQGREKMIEQYKKSVKLEALDALAILQEAEVFETEDNLEWFIVRYPDGSVSITAKLQSEFVDQPKFRRKHNVKKQNVEVSKSDPFGPNAHWRKKWVK